VEGGEPSLPRVCRTSANGKGSWPCSLDESKRKYLCSPRLLCDRLLWDDILPRVNENIIDHTLSILGVYIMYKLIFICMYIYTHTYKHTYIHIHIYTYIHIHRAETTGSAILYSCEKREYCLQCSWRTIHCSTSEKITDDRR
jgi:hypothetical protein